MDDGRSAFIKYVLDNAHSPIAVLGAAIAFARVSSSAERRIADAADAAIKREVEAMKAERNQSKISP